MKAFYDPVQEQHDPKFFLFRGKPSQSPEQAERAQRLLEGLGKIGLTPAEPTQFGHEHLAAIHDSNYLDFLENVHALWQELPGEPSLEVVANVHPSRYEASYPQGIIGRAGWHMADTACPIGPNTFGAAKASANCALSAAQSILEGENHAYALCRPPGHHAYGDMAGGFCFLNNSAIAAEYLRGTHEKVAILDVDVHHGNGTQGIFYERGDVLTVSLHCDPANFYPFFWGYAHETGAGEGEGANLNLPLAPLSGDDVFLAGLETAKTAINQFGATALVVALGLDASEHDPLKGLSVTTQGFGKISKSIAELQLPTIHVQEGGYLSRHLSDNLASYLGGL